MDNDKNTADISHMCFHVSHNSSVIFFTDQETCIESNLVEFLFYFIIKLVDFELNRVKSKSEQCK